PEETPAPPASKRSTQGCPEGFSGNHGQHVSSAPKDGTSRSEAARSDCGKPVRPERESTEGDEELTTAERGPKPGHGQGAGRGQGSGRGEGSGRGQGRGR
ncbi:MAG TPA: hypothetical protein VM840_00370, partial [Actinomycetota bacterium]|nr:hypothetical protein [Actinomycetota bacterium]